MNSCTVHDVLAQEDIFSHTEMKVFLSLFQSLAKIEYVQDSFSCLKDPLFLETQPEFPLFEFFLSA